MLLGRVIMEMNDAKEEILLMLDKVVLHQKEMGARLKQIEAHVFVAPSPSGYNQGNTNPIDMDISTSS